MILDVLTSPDGPQTGGLHSSLHKNEHMKYMKIHEIHKNTKNGKIFLCDAPNARKCSEWLFLCNAQGGHNVVKQGF